MALTGEHGPSKRGLGSVQRPLFMLSCQNTKLPSSPNITTFHGKPKLMYAEQYSCPNYLETLLHNAQRSVAAIGPPVLLSAEQDWCYLNVKVLPVVRCIVVMVISTVTTTNLWSPHPHLLGCFMVKRSSMSTQTSHQFFLCILKINNWTSTHIADLVKPNFLQQGQSQAHTALAETTTISSLGKQS